MYQVLARKWRPKQFDEIIGQPHITKTLKNALTNKKIAHAYLFAGTRGVGKTTAARIFAKAIQCEEQASVDPCGKCISCRGIDDSSSLDYLEIDGASNNGVDNIRDLIDSVQYLPSRGSYRVFVIDEVHMLSTGAFNALLKTLEEPPSHVVFIFATTDPKKLLGTVLSRCQRFDFKSVEKTILEDHIKKISLSEGIEFESEKLISTLAHHGDGSVRDTLSLLDQVLSLSETSTIKEDDLSHSLGIAHSELVEKTLVAIFSQDADLFYDSFQKLLSNNIDISKFLEQILNLIYLFIRYEDKDTLIDKSDILFTNNSIFEFVSELNSSELMWIYESLLKDSVWVFDSFNALKAFEFIVLKVIKREEILAPMQYSKKKVLNDKTPPSESHLKEPVSVGAEKKTLETNENDRVHKVNSRHSGTNRSASSKKISTTQKKSWEGLINFLKSEKKSLAINMERAIFSETYQADNIELKFSELDKIFYDYLSEPENFRKLKDAVAQYNSLPVESINIKLSLIDERTKRNDNLKSKVEIDQLNKSDQEEADRKKILMNKYVQEAQKVFNTKISEIRLNKSKEDKSVKNQ